MKEKEPWIGIPGNYKYINVATEEKDSDSVLNYYRELIRLRKEYQVIQDGRIEFLYREQPEIFAYRRLLGNQELIVLNNMTDRDMELKEPVSCMDCRMLIGNYPWENKQNQSVNPEKPERLGKLRPYESIVLIKE